MGNHFFLLKPLTYRILLEWYALPFFKQRNTYAWTNLMENRIHFPPIGLWSTTAANYAGYFGFSQYGILKEHPKLHNFMQDWAVSKHLGAKMLAPHF